MTSMRIGLDVRKYFDFGIGTYIQNLLDGLDAHVGIDAVLFAGPKDAGELQRKHKGKVVVNRSPKYSLGELLTVARQANNARVDVFHCPHYTLPLGVKARKVVTIHDVIHLSFREHFSLAQRAYARMMVRHACRASDAVIADSDFTKTQLLQMIDVKPEKVRTIHLGVREEFREVRSEKELAGFRSTYKIKSPYLLYTGSLKPHKNIPVLLEAFGMLCSEHDVQLAFAGERPSQYPELAELLIRHRIAARVIELGRIDQRDLVTAYKGARGVVLPSLHEGFGFPVVEAMAAGVPVIAAHAGAIPEVAGDAGLLFDPTSAAELYHQLARLLSDSALASQLIARGKERSMKFTWEDCVSKTIEVYHSVL
jgi:glycosyltransferase involved in cell wall biosynthesis